MLSPIYHSLLHVNEEIGLYTKIGEVLRMQVTDESQLKPFLTKLDAAIAKAIEASSKERANFNTPAIQSCEKTRDTAFECFRDAAKTTSKSINATRAINAEYIVHLIRSVKWNLHRCGNKEQTALMQNLKDKLSTPEAQESIQKADLTEFYNDMLTTNDAYLAELDKRTQDKADKEDIDNEIAYKELREIGEKTFKAIEVVYMLNNEVVYKNIADKINVITEEYMAVGRSRRTRNNNQVSTEPTPEQAN